MILDPNELRQRIREAMQTAGIDAAELARRVNRKPDYFRDFLNGRKSSVKLGELAKLDEVLGLEPGSLGYFSDLPTGKVSNDAKFVTFFKQKPEDANGGAVISNRRMLIHQTEDIGSGCMKVTTNDPVDIVARPWFLKYEADGFGLLVNGGSMSPAFDSGDVVIVNTVLPPAKDRYALFVSGDRSQPEFVATLRRLIDWDDAHWRVLQVRDGVEATLPRNEWHEALRVVATLDV